MAIGKSYYSPEIREQIKYQIKTLFPAKDCTILDVGPGEGKYGIVLKHLAKQIDAVEIYYPTIEINNLDKIYDVVFISDVCDFDFDYYDIIVMGDILEHLSVDRAQKLLDRLYNKSKEIFIVVPYMYEQDELEGNPYEKHLQPDLTHEVFIERYPNFECVYRNAQQGLYIKRRATHIPNKDFKICVYAIAKNEEQFVNRFCDSMLEADYVVVLDTGSTDNTVQLLRDRGVTVEQKVISPWRFDVARNESMKLIPNDADICVCLDLDEIVEPGWADILRKNWTEYTDLVKYLYTWSHDSKGKPLIQIWQEKIHANDHEWYWRMPVHEVLTHKSKQQYEINTLLLKDTKFHVHHFPDDSKPRSSYLGLMELGLKESPDDYMQNYYYGRELFFWGRYQDAINQISKFLSLGPGNSNYLLAAAYGYMGKSEEALGLLDNAEHSYIEALAHAKDIREPYLNLIELYYKTKRWYACIDRCLQALTTSPSIYWYEDSKNYRDKVHDYLSIAYYNIEKYKESLDQVNIALSYEPNDERLLSNKKFAVDAIEKRVI